MRTGSWSENLTIRKLGRQKKRQQDNMKTDIREIVCGDVRWIEMTNGELLYR
jgi:hypothetical protein